MERVRDLKRLSRLAQEVLFSLVTEESCMNLTLGNALSFSHHPMPTPYAYIDMAHYYQIQA